LNGYQAAIAGKIASQPDQELLDTLPPDPGIDVAAELAKVNPEIELPERLLAVTAQASGTGQ
jgi:hypothetical protein